MRKKRLNKGLVALFVAVLAFGSYYIFSHVDVTWNSSSAEIEGTGLKREVTPPMLLGVHTHRSGEREIGNVIKTEFNSIAVFTPMEEFRPSLEKWYWDRF